MDSKSSFGITATIAVVQIGVFIYDVLTYPIYTLLQRPWETIARSKRKRATIIEAKDDHITYRSGTTMKRLQMQLREEGVNTMVGVFDYAVKTHRNLPVLGQRRLLEEKGESQPDGRVFQKFVLGDYEWSTYNEVDTRSTAFGAGLIALGQQVKHNVVILAETRCEWLVAAFGCMKYNIPIVTLYATLGEEAIAHGINETEVTHIITSHDLLPKFKKVLASTPKVTNIIFMEHQLHKANTDGFRPGVTFTPYRDVIERGKSSEIRANPPSPTDTAIIMYTSGSTGTPKGVVLTHENMVASLVSFSAQIDFFPTDVYMGFLPLAHVLELLAESVCMLVGIRIGYSSPLTITDNSSKIMRGTKGDASVLRPTIMASVPLILDRIYKAIVDKVKKGSALQRAIFKFAYDYKRRWNSYGYSTPLIDRLVFDKIKAVVGGNLRGMAVGGAPLSPDTQEFIRTCLSCKVVQGYGLTESTAAATLQDWEDMNVGAVGSPLACCDIKLVSWEEGNYRVTDKPNPRGEVYIGGDNVSMGYYKNEAKTKEDFCQTLDPVNGGVRRWFKTGDIGEMMPEGIVRIIDRKKDLVKLQYGEYVSLGKVETELSTLPIVENICIYGDPTKLFTVALVVPNEKQLKDVATKVGVQGAFEQLCQDAKINAEVLKDIQAHGKKCRLEKFEIPQAVTLCSEMWTPDNSLVTAAFKLRRINIEKRYKEDINRMYSCNG